MDNFFSKTASSSDRKQAVVQGQEDLSGVKSLNIKRTLKKNSDDEYVVTQSTRTEMIYDTVDKAKSAYKDIQNAKEELIGFEFANDNSYLKKVVEAKLNQYLDIRE